MAAQTMSVACMTGPAISQERLQHQIDNQRAEMEHNHGNCPQFPQAARVPAEHRQQQHPQGDVLQRKHQTVVRSAHKLRRAESNRVQSLQACQEIGDEKQSEPQVNKIPPFTQKQQQRHDARDKQRPCKHEARKHLIFVPGLHKPDPLRQHRRRAYEGRSPQPASPEFIIRFQRSLPYPQRQHTIQRRRAQLINLAPRVLPPPGVRRQLAAFADLAPIPVDLVCILQLRNQHRDLRSTASDLNVLSVPRKAGVAGMGLIAPGGARVQLFPTAIVQGRRGPVLLITQVELPLAFDQHDSGAGALQH